MDVLILIIRQVVQDCIDNLWNIGVGLNKALSPGSAATR